MKKCTKCEWSSDKCKNPKSQNFNKYIGDIVKCKPLIEDSKFSFDGEGTE